MKTFLHRGFMAMLAVWLAVVACGGSLAPTPIAPIAIQPNVAETAAALVLTAQVGAAPSASPEPQSAESPAAEAAPCEPMVTASMNANVRSGPSTDYEAIGSLLEGDTASVAGHNDGGSWWYIEFADGPGGHGWVAKSTTTSSCLPDTLTVVAAPPLPATDTPEPEVVAQPDLIINSFSITPATPVKGQPAQVKIGTYNQGNAASGPYTVQWFGLSSYAAPSCSWNVDNSNAHGGRVLECEFIFQSPYPANKTSLAIVDAGNQVDESDEGNNEATISPFGVNSP